MFSAEADGPRGMVSMSKQNKTHVSMGHLFRRIDMEKGVMGATCTSVERSMTALMGSGPD